MKNTEINLNTVKDVLKNQKFDQDQQATKVKELQDTVYKLENIQIPSINNQLGQLATQEELTRNRIELEEKVKLNSIKSAVEIDFMLKIVVYASSQCGFLYTIKFCRIIN